MKKALTIVLIALLSLGLAAVIPVSAVVDPQPAQAMWVDPAFTDGLANCMNFTVDIYVNVTTAGMNPGATGLYAWEFKLYYENDKVEAVSFTDHLPYSNWNPPNSFAGGAGIENAYNATHGRVYRAISAIPAVVPNPTPFVGVMSVCTIVFHVVYPPGDPEHVGALDLVDTITGDDTGGGFAHTHYDGSYRIPYVPPPAPTLELYPAYKKGELGVLFNMSIRIKNLAPAWNVCGWEAKISYNTTVLDALNSYEGPFLPGFAGPNGTYYLNVINDTAGIIHTAGLFLGNHTEPFGTGVLANIEFNATYEFMVPTEGSPPFLFPLDLYDTILVDCNTDPINHTATDATYEAPYATLGWNLDCTTWNLRKPLSPNGTLYETPFIGEGPNMPADAFEPQELVVLYAYLTYNEVPEQNKDVAFEIYGPQVPGSENITIFRVARTNADGVATINFTIPWPCDNPEEVVIGKWYCFQKVQVKDPWDPIYYATPNDTLMWDVGWYVELLNVTVDPNPVPKESWLTVTACYKVISQIPRSVIFTFTILDDLLDPIATIWTEVTVEPGVYCNPAEDCIVVQLYIPKWAHVGPRARVYVNAFSGLPTTCGVPYSPEASAGFTIEVV